MPWISVKDKIPCVGQYCIVTDEKREALAIYHSSGFCYMSPPLLNPSSWKAAYLMGKYEDIGTRGELVFIPDGVILEDGSEWNG